VDKEEQTMMKMATTVIIIIITPCAVGIKTRARCSVVVKALCYKSEGLGFET
jgi:hypothetical protein